MGVNKRRREAEEKQHALSRRRVLTFGGIGVLLAGGGGLALKVYDAWHPSFTEAYSDLEKRKLWLENIDASPYAKLTLVTPEILEGLRQRFQYTPPDGAFAATFPDDEQKVGKGTNSTVYLYDEVFHPRYHTVTESIGIIIENVLKRHELLHAEHFSQGIVRYPMEQFMNPDGSLNKGLFTAASEVLCYRSEYFGLSGEKDGFVTAYANALVGFAQAEVIKAAGFTKDEKLVARLLHDATF
jgi:hypothetical protein